MNKLLLALGLLVFIFGCGGSGGDSKDEQTVPDGVTRFDDDGDGLTDRICGQGGRGGDVTINNSGNGDIVATGGDGGDGDCQSIDDGNNNVGQPDDHSTSDDDTSSESTTTSTTNPS